MKRSAGVLVSGVIAGLVLVGCSPAVQGGDTKCKDFLLTQAGIQTVDGTDTAANCW